MLRSALIGVAMFGLAAPAFASGFSFKTVEPVKGGEVVVLDTVWTCNETVCTGKLDRKVVTVRDCKKLAKKVGEITDFRNTKSELDAADLETCKASLDS